MRPDAIEFARPASWSQTYGLRETWRLGNQHWETGVFAYTAEAAAFAIWQTDRYITAWCIPFAQLASVEPQGELALVLVRAGGGFETIQLADGAFIDRRGMQDLAHALTARITP